MFIVVLLIIAQTTKQPNSHQQLNRGSNCVILSTKYYSAIKMSKLMTHTNESQNTILTEKPDPKEYILYYFIYIKFKNRQNKRKSFLRLRYSGKLQKSINSCLDWVWRKVSCKWT